MGLDQKLIQEQINNEEIVVQCCVYGTFRSPLGNWVGFHLNDKYRRISHGYSPQAYAEIREFYGIKKKQSLL